MFFLKLLKFLTKKGGPRRFFEFTFNILLLNPEVKKPAPHAEFFSKIALS
jgi:hypothetical protein